MRLLSYGPTGDSENATRYSAGESNTGLPEDYSLHYRRMGALQTEFFYDVSSVSAAGTPGYGYTGRRVYLRVWRLPSVLTAFWSNTGTVQGSQALHLMLDAAGAVWLYNKGNQAFPGEVIGGGSLGTVTLGVEHTIEVSCLFETSILKVCSAVGCGLATGKMDANPLISGASFIDFLGNPNSGEGIGKVQLGYREILGRAEGNAPLADLDFANLVVDSASIPGVSRVTAVRCAANGTYQEWLAGGIADYRARNTWPGVNAASVGFTTGVSTSTAGQKQSYLMEAMPLRGITGSILNAHVHLDLIAAPGTVPDLIVIRNGVEALLPMWVLSAPSYARYRLDTTGWATTDTLEFGLRSSAGSFTLASLLLTVEHDTAVPPITLGDISTDIATWTGNDVAQTATLPLSDPQCILWWPRTTTAAGGLWLAEANTAHQCNVPGASRPNFIVKGTDLQLVGAESGGPNSSGVVYDALVIRDPKMRMLCAGAYAQVNGGDDNYPVAMLDPAGAPFTPEALWATQETINTETFIRYYGVGMSGDLSTPLLTASAPGADFIQALTPTGFTAGASLNEDIQQVSYVGFRTGEFNTSILMALTSYIGDGAAGTRVVPVSLGGLVVKWAIVVPLTGAGRAIRNNQHASGKHLSSGGGVYGDSIEGLGADSITVGTALNQLDIGYSVMVWGYGTDPEPPTTPDAGWSCALPDGGDSGGGLGCKALLSSGSDSGGGSGCRVAL